MDSFLDEQPFSEVEPVEQNVVLALVLDASKKDCVSFTVYSVLSDQKVSEIMCGRLCGIGADAGGFVEVKLGEGEEGEAKKFDYALPDAASALKHLTEVLVDQEKGGKVKDLKDVLVIGHRVAHGGESLTKSALIDAGVLDKIKAASDLAPYNNPASIMCIEAAQAVFTECPQIAVFDTSFHATMPSKAFMYAIPKGLYKEHGIRRYGFHGSSYEYVCETASKSLGLTGKLNAIIIYLGEEGEGSSACVVKDGKCIDTSMGLTPLEGLVMATRCGDVDPAMAAHLAKVKGLSVDEALTVLRKESGMKGLCGLTDLTAICAKAKEGDVDCQEACAVYVHRIRKYLGSYYLQLGGHVNAVIFTGETGVTCAALRADVCADMENMGLAIDAEKNTAADASKISEVHMASSKCQVLVIPSDQQQTIALQAVKLTNVAPTHVTKAAPLPVRPSVDVLSALPPSKLGAGQNSLRRSMSRMRTASGFMASIVKRTSIDAARRGSVDGNYQEKKTKCLYVLSLSGRGTVLLELGVCHRIMLKCPSKFGFFRPIANRTPKEEDTHTHLIHSVLRLNDDKKDMCGVDYDTALDLISNGHADELFNRIIEAYEKYSRGKEFVVIAGVTLPVQSMELNMAIASILQTPILFTIKYQKETDDMFQTILLNKQTLDSMPGKNDLQGVIVNRVPPADHEAFKTTFKGALASSGITLAGVTKFDEMLLSFRVNEIHTALKSSVLFGHNNLDRIEAQNFVIAAGTVEQVLSEVSAKSTPSMVLMDARRVDVLLGMLFAVQSTEVKIAGIILTGAAEIPMGIKKLLDSVPNVALPVLMVREATEPVIMKLSKLVPTVMPSSKRKIEYVENMFDEEVGDAFLSSLITKEAKEQVMTPKIFQYRIFKKARALQKHIVLPEGNDKRVVTAAAELVERGLCAVTLLGNISDVKALAVQLQLDLSKVTVIDPATSEHTQRYADLLYENRKEKGMTPEKALDLVRNDPNYYGTMMMVASEADGMVSGAVHTTADTMRPALQVIKTAPGIALVSSIFFMLLPQQVYVYGDCAINVNPNSQQLAAIAVASAQTAMSFGIKPRVAMLSYATGESNTGELITKVREATAEAKALVLLDEAMKAVPVEGPLQFDAAVDPEVALLKVKTPSQVAGRANVCIFPDLNTGNNAYKAVQQASDCIAMGPIMQGLKKPVNDLSRGCTVDDVVNTVVITCIQANKIVAPPPVAPTLETSVAPPVAAVDPPVAAVDPTEAAVDAPIKEILDAPPPTASQSAMQQSLMGK